MKEIFLLVMASIFEFHFEFQIEICGCADLLNLLEYLLIDNVIVYNFSSVFLLLVKSNKYKNRIEKLLFGFLFYIYTFILALFIARNK
jgi:hypothetical protein